MDVGDHLQQQTICVRILPSLGDVEDDGELRAGCRHVYAGTAQYCSCSQT